LKVCMLVRNQFVHDTRVIKEARSLIVAGHEVEVIAVLGDELPEYEVRDDGIVVRRIELGGIVKTLKGLGVPLQSYLLRSLGQREAWIFSVASRFPSPLTVSGQKVKISKVLFYLLAIVGGVVKAFLGLIVALLRGTVRFLLFAARRIVENMRFFLLTGFYRGFLEAAVESSADVYHAHDLNTLLAVVMAARETNGSVVYDSHELFVQRNTTESLWHRFVWIWQEAHLIRCADRVITVSDSIADVLAERYRIKRPVVIRNVQQYSPFQPSTRLRELPELSHVGSEACIAIYAGRITRGRGLDMLVKASAHLRGVTIVLMGVRAPVYYEHLKKEINSLDVRDKVILLPPVESDQVNEYLCSADMGLMPTENICLSYRLGAGNKLFHYLMAGLPVLVSDQPEKRKIVEQYDVGRVFDPEDPNDIARAIQELADDAELRRRLSENALAAAKVLNWENEEKKLIELYRSIEKKRRR
jgi:glycosyltransferase involved in cell wall biosynthesis